MLSFVWMLPCTSCSGLVPAHDTGLLDTGTVVSGLVLLVRRVELDLSVASDSSHLFLSALVGLTTVDTGVTTGVLSLVPVTLSSTEHRAVVLDLK